MSNLVVKPNAKIPATADYAMAVTRQVEAALLEREQVELETTHSLHAGLYSRTVRVPAGVMLTGALIQIPTVLTIVGDLALTIDDKVVEVHGFRLFECQPGRKQIMLARSESYVTMSFATNAKTVEEAEEEFTPEFQHLMSRRKE
jgi:hypothetical protein